MLEELLRKNYDIHVQERIHLGHSEAFKRDRQLFSPIACKNIEEDELTEMEKLAFHMKENGDANVSVFLRAKDGKIFSEWDGSRYTVLYLPRIRQRKMRSIGKSLSKFHARGKTVMFPVEKISRIGQWKNLWEKRIDQLEKVWSDRLFQHPENEFETLFIQSFPYYMGLGENAIQYLTDTELDDDPTAEDSGTICHHRFSVHTWGEQFYVKSPLDWVFDHCSRDLAEWTRERYLHKRETHEKEIRQFFFDYQTRTPLSSFSWRLLYARLLFPLHYIEGIEQYYTTNSEQRKNEMEEQLAKLLQRSQEYERFLGNFFQIVEVPVRSLAIPAVEWLN
ncbi:spore coat protein YutH [Bacillaceae bacterium Marseille-Q3522]|nr:spore coat protein YutH [Bacillaceae bacterium Marseille-Q3522]